jgi:hypothetical protein
MSITHQKILEFPELRYQGLKGSNPVTLQALDKFFKLIKNDILYFLYKL